MDVSINRDPSALQLSRDPATVYETAPWTAEVIAGDALRAWAPQRIPFELRTLSTAQDLETAVESNDESFAWHPGGT
jgi:hypothetical protein